MRPGRRRCARWASVATVTVLLVAVPGVTGAGAAGRTHTQPAVTSLTRPVDLATPVDLAAALARPSAVLRYGKARIEVLSASLLRLEYSPPGHFVDRPTVNATDRRRPVPHYVAGVAHGWLTVRTAKATLRYLVGSGPFTPANTTLRRPSVVGLRPFTPPGSGSAPSARSARPARPGPPAERCWPRPRPVIGAVPAT